MCCPLLPHNDSSGGCNLNPLGILSLELWYVNMVTRHYMYVNKNRYFGFIVPVIQTSTSTLKEFQLSFNIELTVLELLT